MNEIAYTKLMAFIWFAWIGSVTPGPNNALALSTATNFGIRAIVPLSIGVAVGFSSLLIAASLGAQSLLREFPQLAFALRAFGVLYLCWLGLQLARAGMINQGEVIRPPRWYETAALQYANPKAWMLAVGTVAAYRGLASSPEVELMLIVIIFAVSTISSNFIWAVAGASLARWMLKGVRLRFFNSIVGVSLIATGLWLWFVQN